MDGLSDGTIIGTAIGIAYVLAKVIESLIQRRANGANGKSTTSYLEMVLANQLEGRRHDEKFMELQRDGLIQLRGVAEALARMSISQEEIKERQEVIDRRLWKIAHEKTDPGNDGED